MKTEDNAQLSEGMQLIFDQGTSSASRSSSTDRSYSSSQSGRSSYGSRGSRRHRHRSRSSSDSSSSSNSRSRTRSRSRPRCHRASGHSRCRHHSPPRHYRARSRSYSASPNCSSHRGQHRHRAFSRSSSRSSGECYSRRQHRSRSRSFGYRHRFVERYRCKFSQSPRRSNKIYRTRSRSPQRSVVRLSQKEKKDLLNIAKENAIKILGVQNLELPIGTKSSEQPQPKRQMNQPEFNTEERVRADPVPLKRTTQDTDMTNEDETITRTSPTRKQIVFSISNTVAKPSSSPMFHVTESKVTSRADSVGNRKPYGQWIPVKKSKR